VYATPNSTKLPAFVLCRQLVGEIYRRRVRQKWIKKGIASALP